MANTYDSMKKQLQDEAYRKMLNEFMNSGAMANSSLAQQIWAQQSPAAAYTAHGYGQRKAQGGGVTQQEIETLTSPSFYTPESYGEFDKGKVRQAIIDQTAFINMHRNEGVWDVETNDPSWWSDAYLAEQLAGYDEQIWKEKTIEDLIASSTGYGWKYSNMSWDELMEEMMGDEELTSPYVEDWLRAYNLTAPADSRMTWEQLQGIADPVSRNAVYNDLQKRFASNIDTLLNSGMSRVTAPGQATASETLTYRKERALKEQANRQTATEYQAKLADPQYRNTMAMATASGQVEVGGKTYPNLWLWATDTGNTELLTQYEEMGYGFLLPEELLMYQQLYEINPADAMGYLKSRSRELNVRRKAFRDAEKSLKATDGFWNGIISWAESRATPIETILTGDILRQTYHAWKGDADPNAYYFDAQNDQYAIDTAQHNEVEAQFGSTAAFFFDAFNNVVDVAVPVALGAAVGAPGAVNMGINVTKAYSGSLQSNASRDIQGLWSVGQALGDAGIEALFEKLGYDGSTKSASKIWNFLRNAFGEGAEEVFTNMGTTAFDAVMSAAQGRDNMLVEMYKAYTLAGAENPGMQVVLDKAAELGMDFVMGAIPGGTLGGVQSAADAISTRNLGKSIAPTVNEDALLEIARAMPEGSESRRLAQKYFPQDLTGDVATEATTESEEPAAKSKKPGKLETPVELTGEAVPDAEPEKAEGKAKKPGKIEKPVELTGEVAPEPETEEAKAKTKKPSLEGKEVALDGEAVPDKEPAAKKAEKPGKLEKSVELTGEAVPDAETAESTRTKEEKKAEKPAAPKKGKLSFYQLGRLTQALEVDLQEEHSRITNDVMDSAIANRLMELGDDAKTARANAPIIRKVYRGQEVALTERAGIAWNKNASQVARELASTLQEDAEAKTEQNAKGVVGDRTTASDEARVGKSWQTAMGVVADKATAHVRDMKTQLREALTNKKSALNEAISTAKSKAAKVARGSKNVTSKMVTISDGESGTESKGEFRRFKKHGSIMEMVVFSDGAEKTVSVEDMTQAEGSGMAEIIEYVADGGTHDMSEAEANTLAQVYQSVGGDVDSVIRSYEMVYLSGYTGMEMPANVLPDAAAKAVYDSAKAEAAADEKTRVDRAKAVRRTTKGLVTFLGKVSKDSEVRGAGSEVALSEAMEGMTDSQQQTVEVVRAFAHKFQINMVLFESTDEGVSTMQNGSYDPTTHTVYIDINSGANSTEDIKEAKELGTLGYAMMRTLGHEVTHAIESTSAEGYAAYKAAVKEKLGKRWSGLVQEKLVNALDRGRKLTLQGAEAEVVADASEYMLQDSKFVGEIDKTVRGKIKAVIADFVQKVRSIFSTLRGGHRESEALRRMKGNVYHYLDNLQQLWDVAAEEMVSKSEEDGIDTTESYDVPLTEETASEGKVLPELPEMGKKYSYAGRGSENANRSLLHEAQEMEFDEVDPETIRQQTGWFRGMDGEWRYEIDDSQAEYKSVPVAQATKLKHIYSHPVLFEAYPDLAETPVEVLQNLPGNANAGVQGGTVKLNANKFRDPSGRLVWNEKNKDTLLHEIQHLIQAEEGFASGSNVDYWAEKLFPPRRNDRLIRRLDKQIDELYNAHTEEQWSLLMRYEDAEHDWAEMDIDADPERYWQAMKDLDKLQKELDAKAPGLREAYGPLRMHLTAAKRHNPEMSPQELYQKTAGEIEARDTAERRGLTPEQRRATLPALDEDAVFADDVTRPDIRYSARSNAVETAAEMETTDGQRMFSLRSFTEDYDTYRSMLLTHGSSVEEVDALFYVIDEVMKDVEANREVLDFGWNVGREDRSFSPVKPNSDPLYEVSMDFSTLCRKRLLQQAVQERLESMYDTVLTKAERVAIRNELMKLREAGKQIEVACALCYVESTRLKSPAQIQRFFDDRRAVMVDYFAKKNKAYMKSVDEKADELIVKFGYEPGTAKKNLKTKFQKDSVTNLKQSMYKKYEPTAEEEAVIETALSLPGEAYKTDVGLWNLKKEHPVIFDAYTSYVRNATKSKGIEGDEAWWAGDSQSISDGLIAKMNAENGLRTQSWSDFQVIHLLDYISAIIELSTRGAKMQSYTKVPDFVNLMGDTGVMINLSLIPKGFDGTLNYDPIEGMPIETALALREMFPNTAGTICIGITTEHIRMLLADPNTDYVIPYHSSSLDKKTRQQMGMKVWQDFQKYQNEKEQEYSNTVKGTNTYHKKPTFSEWFDYETVSARASEVGAERAMQEAADRYIDLCHRRGLQEKFAQFSSEPNYWKLLIDRKMINQQTGEIIRQEAVKPRFDLDRIRAILKDEVNRFKSQNQDFNDAVAHIERSWANGDIRKAAKSKKVKDAVSAFEDTVTVANIVASAQELDSQGNVQHSTRDLPTDAISIREYLGSMTPTSRMTDTERSLLGRYQAHLKTLGEKEAAIAEQEEIIRTAPLRNEDGTINEELQKAKNRIRVLREQAARESRALAAAETSTGFARLMATSRQMVDTYLLGASGSVADAADALDEEVATLTERLKGLAEDITRTAVGQRTAFARGLYDQKQLNAAAKSLKDAYGSRMSVQAIADRLALCFGELYEDGSADGVKRFVDDVRELATDILQGHKYRYKSEVLPLLREKLGTISLTELDLMEIKNAGLTLTEYKRMLSPYVTVAEGGSDLSSAIDGTLSYGDGTLAAILGEDVEGNLAMRLYEVISNEKAREAEIGTEGMTEGEMITAVMADIAGATLPVAEDSRTIDYLRKELKKHAGASVEASQLVDEAIAGARKVTGRAGRVWAEAAKNAQTAKAAVEYYRKLEEQRRVTELREQKQAITEQLRSEYAKSLEEKVQKQRAEYREREQNARKYRNSRDELNKLRRTIGRKVKRLNALRVRETDAKHVPQELQHIADVVMQTFTDSSLGRLAFSSENMASLSRRYHLLKEQENDMAYYWDPEIEEQIELLQTMGEAYTAIRERGAGIPSYFSVEGVEMEMEILNGVDNIVSNVLHMIDDWNDAFISGRTETFNVYAAMTGKELLDKKDFRQWRGGFGALQKAVDELLRTGNMTPVYYMEHLNSPLLQEVFDAVREGQSRYARIVAEGKAFVQEAKERYHYGAWVADAKLQMKTSQGHQIELTREEAIELYAIAKRERTNKLYLTEHLINGGFQFKDVLKKKGKGMLAAEKTTHQLDAADIARIENWLTAEQKAYADALVGFLSTTMAEYGNEAAMAMFGYKKFNEAYYVPFHTAAEQRYQRGDEGPGGEDAGTGRVKNSGFTKKLTYKANATLVVGGLTDTVSEHIHKMATYAALVEPIENMKRLLNYKMVDKDGTTNTIRALIGKKYGQASQDYMTQLLKDLNGAAQGDERATKGVNWLISAFKRGAVMASASVVLQQPTAIVRAMADIPVKYFGQNPFYRPGKGTWDEMMKYSGTAIIKDMGKFDVGMGLTASQYIADEHLNAVEAYRRLRAEGRWEAGKAGYKRFMERLTAAPGKADQWTWGLIWKANKARQADLHPDMDHNSDAFLELCGRTFDDVIDHTQVYDSVLTRSNLMRSKNGFHQMATSFMAEPTMSINMLYDAVMGKHRPGKRAAIIGGVMASQVLAGAMAALVQAWNDDEDKRNWLEKYADRATGNILGNINVFSMIPYISDFVSLLEGYDVERADMTVLSTLLTYSGSFFEKVGKGESLTWKDWENFAGNWANLTGVPAKNIMREIRRALNAVTKTGWSAPNMSNVGLAMSENLIWNSGRNTEYYERIVAADLRGDEQAAEDYREYMLTSKMVSEKQLKEGIRAAAKDQYQRGKMTKADAKEYLIEKALAKDEKEAFTYVDKWDEEWRGDEDPEYNHSVYDTVREAIDSGEAAAIKASIKELMDNGWAEDTVKSNVRTYLKSKYAAGEMNQSQVKSMYKAYCLPDGFDASDENNWYWLFKELDYYKKNGLDAETWEKYSDFYGAVETGTNLTATVKMYLDHGVKKGTLSSCITTHYKQQYIDLYTSGKRSEASVLQSRILTAYVALGYDRNRKLKDVQKWLEEKG